MATTTIEQFAHEIRRTALLEAAAIIDHMRDDGESDLRQARDRILALLPSTTPVTSTTKSSDGTSCIGTCCKKPAGHTGHCGEDGAGV